MKEPSWTVNTTIDEICEEFPLEEDKDFVVQELMSLYETDLEAFMNEERMPDQHISKFWSDLSFKTKEALIKAEAKL